MFKGEEDWKRRKCANRREIEEWSESKKIVCWNWKVDMKAIGGRV